MRLSARLIAFVLLSVVVLLFVDGLFSVRREIVLFDGDMKTDAEHLGAVLAELIEDSWTERGPDGSREFVRRLNREDGPIRLRLVRLDASPGGQDAPIVDARELEPLREGRPVSVKLPSGRDGYRYTYVPIEVDRASPPALELAEPLTALYSYTRETVLRALVLGAVVVLIGALIIWLLGVHFVGRPLELLVEKTRRVGRGDFSCDVVIRGRGELSALATAMNEMCKRLEKANEAVRTENEARIAALEQMRHSERLATLGRISSGLAHELGTPLNVISGRAKLIAAGRLQGGEISSSADIIAQQTDRMTNIIRELLSFARRPSTHKADESIERVLQKTLVMLDPTARAKDVRIEVAKRAELPTIRIDPSQIEQVFMNIIMNGIHASPGGGRILVEFSVEDARPRSEPEARPKPYVVTRVRDEGEGISAENLELVFEPFFTTKPSGEGTGLGLPVVKGIVEEHGGWIEVESEIGKGACFVIFLPVEER
jgi:two-component system NtrC family sensor kinase